MKIKPTIKTPCPANWDKMKIGVNSRYCGNCEKYVVDFTKKSREEILEYLILNHQSKTCGHFFRHQLDYAEDDFMVTVTTIAEKQKDPRLGLAVLVFGSIMMAGCSEPTHEQVNSNIDLMTKGTEKSFTISEVNNKHDTIEAIPPAEKPVAKNTSRAETISIIEPTITGDIEPELLIDGMVTMGEVDLSSSQTRLDYVLVETKPEFPGGLDSLSEFIAANIKYPAKSVKARKQGKVYIGFVIDTTGFVKEPEIIKSFDPSLDSAALDVVNKLPKWTPGESQGQKVEVQFTLPVNFKL